MSPAKSCFSTTVPYMLHTGATGSALISQRIGVNGAEQPRVPRASASVEVSSPTPSKVDVQPDSVIRHSRFPVRTPLRSSATYPRAVDGEHPVGR